MPTFSNEGSEPPHIHVDKAESSVKFWLEPISEARNYGFSKRELRQVEEKVREEQQAFLKAWHDYFGT